MAAHESTPWIATIVSVIVAAVKLTPTRRSSIAQSLMDIRARGGRPDTSMATALRQIAGRAYRGPNWTEEARWTRNSGGGPSHVQTPLPSICFPSSARSAVRVDIPTTDAYLPLRE